MKKIKYLIFILICLFAFDINVKAENILRECTYSINFNGFGDAKDINYNFKGIIYDNGTASVSDFSNISGSENLGALWIGKQSNKILWWGKTFDENYYLESNGGTHCPSIAFVWDGNNNITMRLVGNTTEIDALIKQATLVSEKGADGEKTQETIMTICSTRRYFSNESNKYLDIKFIKINGEYNFQVKSSLNDSWATAKVGLASVGNYSVRLEDDITQLASNCNTNMYLHCQNGSSENIYLSLSKPDDSENCSYSINEAENDDGSEPVIPIDEPTKNSYWDSTDGKTIALLKKIYGMLKVGIPLLVIILSIADYLKVLFTSEEKNYKEAFNKFIKRIIIGIILFVLPAVISLLIYVAGLGDAGIAVIFK